MDVLLTGATGYLGSEVARLLTERGDRVRALVADPADIGELHGLPVELVVGDLDDEGALVGMLHGVGGLVHCAELTGVGDDDDRARLVDVNVCGTEHALGAALIAGVHRAVHVSSVEVLGDTAGRVVDETWTRDPSLPWRSAYEETKAVAHGRAQDLSARGLPVSIVAPGPLYGPGAPSGLGALLEAQAAGRLHALAFGDLGIVPVHRRDAADGVVSALHKGVPGEAYVLAGAPVRLREVVDALAGLLGSRPPRTLPTTMLRLLSPAGALAGPVLGLAPNLGELVRARNGVTCWASSDKAARELGWTARPLLEGLADLVPVS